MVILGLAWSSTEYIGQDGSLQLSTVNMPGAVEISVMNGSITATATVTNITSVNGVLTLESNLRIVAVAASVVTCSGTNGGTESIEFSISGIFAKYFCFTQSDEIFIQNFFSITIYGEYMWRALI